MSLWRVMEVTLTKSEASMASHVGWMRHLVSVLKGLEDKNGCDGKWDRHIEGACGELAVAKALGIYWDGSVNTFHSAGDVGNIEVRTRSRHDYDLIVRPSDHLERRFVLVTACEMAW